VCLLGALSSPTKTCVLRDPWLYKKQNIDLSSSRLNGGIGEKPKDFDVALALHKIETAA